MFFVFISQQLNTYVSDNAKITFIMSLLFDKAVAWTLVLIQNSSPLWNNHQCFVEEMKKVLDHSVQGKQAVIGCSVFVRAQILFKICH